ncbi:putative quinol monooxygenase [Nocardioides sp. SR21]|uniref:putative quinol monooxygenase n=1 Tax=Nocardioides sp. SR21 TaxID=2919501 RepID=UPI001FAA565C|nr:antibiotic biosynthesis monooxygenase family protein [Nocardioides sp. SR21]
MSPSPLLGPITMIIVAGHLTVDPAERAAYLEGCVPVVEAARRAPGCREFAVGADLVDPARVTVLERWDSRASLEAFRGSGPSDDQRATILAADVAEYDVIPAG